MRYSLIVPVFNSELYLEQCIDSLIRQSFDCFELILVNDGSTDSSKLICLRYAEQDSRVKYIECNHNRGASAARNVGLEHASGDYVLFIDNDDWWERVDALDLIESEAMAHDDPDIIAFSLGQYLPGSNKIELKDVRSPIRNDCSFDEAVRTLLEKSLYFSSACAKAVKRSMLVEHSIRFEERWRSNEDSDWSCTLLKWANSIAWVEKTFYIYRRNSIVSQSSKDVNDSVVRDVSELILKHTAGLARRPLSDRDCLIASFISYIYVIQLSYIFMNDTKICKEQRLIQKENQWLFDYAVNSRVKLTKSFMRVFGFSLTGRMLAYVMKRERRAVRTR